MQEDTDLDESFENVMEVISFEQPKIISVLSGIFTRVCFQPIHMEREASVLMFNKQVITLK